MDFPWSVGGSAVSKVTPGLGGPKACHHHPQNFTQLCCLKTAWMLFGVPMPCHMFIGYLYVFVYPEDAPNQILDPLKAPVPAGP